MAESLRFVDGESESSESGSSGPAGEIHRGPIGRNRGSSRGSNRGSTNRIDNRGTETDEEETGETLFVAPQKVRVPRGAKKNEAAKPLALTFLAILESLAIHTLGPEAALQPQERNFIEPPTVRLVSRLPTKQVQAVSGLLDPLTLLLGLSLWYKRVSATKKDKTQFVAASQERASSATARMHADTRNGHSESLPVDPIISGAMDSL